jgi:hypothetical protein
MKNVLALQKLISSAELDFGYGKSAASKACSGLSLLICG